MRSHTPAFTVAILTASVMLACGSGPMPTVRGSYSKSQPANHDPALLHGHYVVPPDQALLPVRIHIKADTAQDAADQVRVELKTLNTALSDTPTCTLAVQDYRPAQGADDVWASEVWATLAVDLGGLNDALTRMDRLDACRGLVLVYQTRTMEEIAGTQRERSLTLGPHTVVVDDPEAHLPQLLERRARALAKVTSTPAPQLHPEDYRCVPTSQVTAGPASLGGVALTLGINCRVDTNVAPPPTKG